MHPKKYKFRNINIKVIYKVLRGYLVSVWVNLQNLAGFAADNCATIMGQLNGVQSI